MDIKQLRALVAVADSGSVTRAAVLLNIVQPAVSRQLKLLEEDLGTSLFDRSRSGMELTDDGHTLLQYARRVLEQIDRARAEIKPEQGSISGLVSIGLLSSTAELLTNDVMNAIAARHPGIRLRIMVGFTGQLRHWIESGEVDMALLYESGGTPFARSRTLVEESLWVVDRPHHLVQPGQPFPLAQLDGVPLILPGTPHGLRGLLDHEAARLGIRLNVVAQTNAMMVQRQLVAGGHGLTVLPAVALACGHGEDMACAPIGEPALLRRIALATPVTRQLGAPERAVHTALTDCMRQAVMSGRWPAARWLAEAG